MSKARIRPNADDYGTDAAWTKYGGAASVVAALSDASDVTHVRSNGAQARSFVAGLGTIAVPANNDIAGLAAGIRSKRGASGYQEAYLFNEAESPIWYHTGTHAVWNGSAIGETTLTAAQCDQQWYDPTSNDRVPWTQAVLEAIQLEVNDPYGDGYIYDAWVDLWYYARLTSAAAVAGGTPVTASSKPTFNLTQTAAVAVDADQVAASWNQALYEVKVFNAAQYNAGGFDPSTSTPFWSAIGSASIALGATAASPSVTAGVALPNDSYRVYVRSTWNFPSAAAGAWSYAAFVVNVTSTDAPTTTAVIDNANGRVTCNVTPIAKAGHASPLIQLQRSSDGGATWTDVYGASALSATFGSASTIYDYLAARATALRYRAAVTTTCSGQQLTSAWTTVVVVGTLAGDTWNFKVPKHPALDVIDTIVLKDPDYSREEDATVLRPKGRTYPVVVSVNLGGADGSLQVRASSADEWAGIQALMDYRAPVYLESAYGWAKWIRITSRSWKELGPVGAVWRVATLGYVEVAADV